jgi:hypothetical protein
MTKLEPGEVWHLPAWVTQPEKYVSMEDMGAEERRDLEPGVIKPRHKNSAGATSGKRKADQEAPQDEDADEYDWRPKRVKNKEERAKRKAAKASELASRSSSASGSRFQPRAAASAGTPIPHPAAQPGEPSSSRRAPDPSSAQKIPAPPIPPVPAAKPVSAGRIPTPAPTPSAPTVSQSTPRSHTPAEEKPNIPGSSSQSVLPPRNSELNLPELEAKLFANFETIDRWTQMMSDYPSQEQALQKQVDRVQQEIFRLQAEIERRKRGGQGC